MVCHSIDIKRNPNYDIVLNKFCESLKILYNNEQDYKLISLIVSDSAKYMKKFVQVLKLDTRFSHIYHMCCFAHIIHKLSEQLRKHTSLLDNFIIKLQKFLIPIKNQYQDFTQLKIPPRYCSTRWGTFISCVKFYYNNYIKIFNFINSRNSKKNSYVKNSSHLYDELFLDENLHCDISQ